MLTLRASTWLAVAASAVLVAGPVHAQPDTPHIMAESHKPIVFSPDRPDRCDYFFVTEFSTAVTGVKSQDGLDRYLFTDALGLMRNIDRTRAVGASIDAHLSAGMVRFAPTLRFRQWLADRSSIELSLGYASASITQEGVVGAIANLRYSPAAWCHVQAGACRIRQVRSIFIFPDYRVDQNTQLQLYAGIGLGGVPGVISWGAQALGAVGLSLALSGMD